MKISGIMVAGVELVLSFYTAAVEAFQKQSPLKFEANLSI